MLLQPFSALTLPRAREREREKERRCERSRGLHTYCKGEEGIENVGTQQGYRLYKGTSTARGRRVCQTLWQQFEQSVPAWKRFKRGQHHPRSRKAWCALPVPSPFVAETSNSPQAPHQPATPNRDPIPAPTPCDRVDVARRRVRQRRGREALGLLRHGTGRGRRGRLGGRQVPEEEGGVVSCDGEVKAGELMSMRNLGTGERAKGNKNG